VVGIDSGQKRTKRWPALGPALDRGSPMLWAVAARLDAMGFLWIAVVPAEMLPVLTEYSVRAGVTVEIR
jgi:hypothetical protein